MVSFWISSFHAIIEKGVFSIGYLSESLDENMNNMVIAQKAIKIAWNTEMYKGIRRAEQQHLTKLEAALIIPIA